MKNHIGPGHEEPYNQHFNSFVYLFILNKAKTDWGVVGLLVCGTIYSFGLVFVYCECGVNEFKWNSAVSPLPFANQTGTLIQCKFKKWCRWHCYCYNIQRIFRLLVAFHVHVKHLKVQVFSNAHYFDCCGGRNSIIVCSCKQSTYEIVSIEIFAIL